MHLWNIIRIYITDSRSFFLSIWSMEKKRRKLWDLLLLDRPFSGSPTIRSRPPPIDPMWKTFIKAALLTSLVVSAVALPNGKDKYQVVAGVIDLGFSGDDIEMTLAEIQSAADAFVKKYNRRVDSDDKFLLTALIIKSAAIQCDDNDGPNRHLQRTPVTGLSGNFAGICLNCSSRSSSFNNDRQFKENAAFLFRQEALRRQQQQRQQRQRLQQRRKRQRQQNRRALQARALQNENQDQHHLALGDSLLLQSANANVTVASIKDLCMRCSRKVDEVSDRVIRIATKLKKERSKFHKMKGSGKTTKKAIEDQHARVAKLDRRLKKLKLERHKMKKKSAKRNRELRKAMKEAKIAASKFNNAQGLFDGCGLTSKGLEAVKVAIQDAERRNNKMHENNDAM